MQEAVRPKQVTQKRFVWLLAVVAAAAAPARGRLENYAVILQDEPVAARIQSRTELHSSRARQHRQSIVMAQRRLGNEFARRHVAVLGSTQVLVNAIYVRMPADRVRELLSLPGVRTVTPLPRVHRHLDQAGPLMGVPDSWNAVGGPANAGAGVKIGIIDTGIDNTHPAFQDSSLTVPDGFPKGDAAFTNNKIIVARSYVAIPAKGDGTPEDSRPDDLSPRDRSGHGTAVAMIAAGAQNTGPLASITGVAPKAWLGNYKIFGTPGVNDNPDAVIGMALDDAFQDGMDIVVLASGVIPAYPPLAQDCPGICDRANFAIEQAVQQAVSRGMTVVISAGNDGTLGTPAPTLNTIDTPGTVAGAITVGASSNAHALFSTVQTGDTKLNATFGDAPQPPQPLTAPLRDTGGPACSPLPAGSLSGAIALIQRGACDFNVKINNAQAAGAVGAVIYQSDGNPMPIPMFGLVATGIPAVMVGDADGATLKTLLQSTPDAPVTINPALQSQPAAQNIVAAYSSHGPNIGDSSIKPELVAVGTNLYTATQSLDPSGDLYSSSGYTAVSGASFAAPVVAGAAALVKQIHPDFQAGRIKSALVNTATQDVSDDSGQAHVTAMGAGKLNAAAAVAVGATVEPSTLSFGAIRTLPASLALTVTNTSSSTATFTLTADNPSIGLSQTSLSLDPGQSRQISAQLTGRVPSPGSYEGFVTIAGANTTLKVPYLYLVGDNVPAQIFPIAGNGFIHPVNDRDWLIAFRLLDRYGVPVTNFPVTFRNVKGGVITAGDPVTDKLGVAGALFDVSSQPGDQVFTGTAGSLTVEFNGYARSLPVISNVTVDGSSMSIFGRNLSDATKSSPLPGGGIQVAGISVSFDSPGVSAPGLVTYVSPDRVDVKIPPEFAGQASAKIKVSIGYGYSPFSSQVFTVPLPASGRQAAASQEAN